MARILVVDDDPEIRELLAKTLERHHYDVLKASNGKEAFELCRDNPVDLVITDIIMPDEEGIQFIGRLRKNIPNIKVIAVSGGGEGPAGSYLEAAELFGAQDTLTKPFNAEQIIEKVQTLLGENQTE